MRIIQVVSLVAVVAIVFFTAGFYVAYNMQQVSVKELGRLLEEREGEVRSLNQQLAEARNRANELSAEVDRLSKLVEELERAEKKAREELAKAEQQLNMLNANLDEKTEAVQKLEEKINSLREIVEKLKNDRVLLNWIRNDIPNERDEAMRFWNDTRVLAARSDSSLAASVDEIRANLGIYFDWLESFPEDVTFEQSPFIDMCNWILQNPESPYNLRSFCQWVFSQPAGVGLYGEAINNFIDAVYLVVMSHIDRLSDVIEEEEG